MTRSGICSAVWLAILLNFFGSGYLKAGISIAVLPGDQTVSTGDSVNLAAVVTATAGETVTGYQWLMSTNGQNPFNLVGTAAALSLADVQMSDAGYYYVKVTYLSGGTSSTASSAKVRLVVEGQPQVLTQPASLVCPTGTNALFSVTMAGAAPMHFQWRHNNFDLTDNGRIAGSAGTVLSITNLTTGDGGNYDVVVTNAYGSTTSQVATLEVLPTAPILTSPTNATGKQGYPFEYTVTASGATPITFGASGLPAGLTLNPASGLVSGVPTVAGVFDVALFATNVVQTATGHLFLSVADDIPVLTSPLAAAGKQGQNFSYTITASNDPASFSANPLPDGLSLDAASGQISGVPRVSGSYPIAIVATNAFGSASNELMLTLASDVPLITSSLFKNGTQGQALSYAITASNDPVSFSAGPLPDGLSVDPATGVIAGVPIISGTFAVTIAAANPWGSDSRTLSLTLTSSVPVITSPLFATATEDQPSFTYTIKATGSPTEFWASGLPAGFSVDTNSGRISGVPLYAGTHQVSLFAANAWGTGTATLQLNINNEAITNLAIVDVMTNYESPYLLEFDFSLRDSDDPLTSHAVVVSPSLLSVTAFEDDVPVSPSETAVILQRVGSDTAKVLKGYLVLDFTESVASLTNGDANNNGISDAVEAEVASAQDFVNQQPADSQMGVYEFHRDDEAPQQVQSLTTDKALLDGAIAGIWTNYVQDFPAGSRAWDALSAAVGSLGAANADERHYVVFMSDGRDESSLSTLDDVIAAATNAQVQIYGVGFGDELDSPALQTIADSTLGRYYPATNPADLNLDFGRIGKDLASQYTLRWATLKRSTNSFMPSFQISYQGWTAVSPSNPPPFISGTNYTYVTNTDGSINTNMDYVYTTNYIIPPYFPTDFSNNLLAGSLRLVSDADVHPAGITLRATYVPRFVRQLRLHYRANWPATLSLQSTNPGEMLYDWSLSETNDGAGGQWALLSSPDPAELGSSIPFAGFGKLLTFSFRDPIVASNAFSELEIDNTIYTNTGGQSFSIKNTNAFERFYAQAPPHGTPVPWLISQGFTNDFAAAELLDPNANGLAVWQDYLAGLDPWDTNSTFSVQLPGVSSQSPNQLVFNTVVGRTYRIEWAPSAAGPWTTLRDNIPGTGGAVTFSDDRDLSTVGAIFYRVAVY